MNETGLVITAPRFVTDKFVITGNAPLVVHRFSEKAKIAMKEKQLEGQRAKKGKARDPRDFDSEFEAAKHVSPEGWCGIHAGGIRSSMISACKLAGFAMTRAKLSFFIEADGYDRVDGMPLVKITKGEPEMAEHTVRLETGVADLRVRPMWREGWQAVLRIRYDADQFSRQDVMNLLVRAGLQVGIGEGRPDSKKSHGMGWGTFVPEFIEE
jgi:hypothetical protein